MKSTKPKRPTKPTNAQKVARRLQCLYILVLRGWADAAANKKYKNPSSPYSKWDPVKLNELITAAAARPELRSEKVRVNSNGCLLSRDFRLCRCT